VSIGGATEGLSSASRPEGTGAKGTGANDVSDASPQRKRRRARRPDPRRVRAVVVLAAGSAVGVVLAGLSPTGSSVGDVLWSAVLGAAMVLFGSRARRWSLLVCSGVALATSSGWMLLVGVLALGLATASVFRERRDRIVDAIVAGLSVQALVRIDDWEWAFQGSSALVTGLACSVVIVSGWRVTSRRWRRRTGIAVGVTAVGAALLTGAFLMVAVLTYNDVADGVALAQKGVDAARDDEQAAAGLFRDASAVLGGAESWLGSPLLLPVQLVPVVAQQHRAVAVATATARDLAATAAEGAALVERDGLRLENGRVDSDAVAALVPALQAATYALEVASADLASLASPWLANPVAERLVRLETAVDEALPGTRLALQGAEVVPGIVGADGPRRWLVIITTPAETRLLGGFVGNWALLETVDGEFDVVDDGGAGEVNGQLANGPRKVDASDEYRLRYGGYRPDFFFQNSSASPDFPSAARVASSFFTQSTGIALDGVLAVDPRALGALVDLGGPVDIPTLDRRFTGDELATFLVTDLYEYDDDTQDEIFADAIDGAIDGITDGQLPAPGAIADALALPVAEGRLLLWSSDADEEDFFTALGADGALPVNDGQDFLLLAVANVGPNKIDTYLRREVSYRVNYDAGSGAVTSEATAVLTNEATLDLPPVVIGNGFDAPLGTARTSVSLYSPFQLRELTVDGVVSAVESQRELGWFTWSRFVEIPAGGSVTLRWTLTGAVDPGTYRFSWRSQPLVIPPVLRLEVRPPGEGDVSYLTSEGPAAEVFGVSVTP
jgi:hypothetical protein